MALTKSPPGEIGSLAPQFDLLATNGRRVSLSDFNSAQALVVIFMCNHCPYVQAIRSRLRRLADDFKPKGVQVVGICSNDSVRYPEDGYEAMKKEALEQAYSFPYLWDETQAIAKNFGAVCTPDFFVYRNEKFDTKNRFVLNYRGRLDDNWKDVSAVKTQDLRLALDRLLAGETPSAEQVPSMGCSIKWKS